MGVAVSLLDRGPETVEIYPIVWVTDSDGNLVQRPADEPVTVSAWVQPLSSAEQVINGTRVVTTYRVITRSAPVDPWARVIWRGQEWSVQGDPEIRYYTPTTSHVTAVIQRG